MLDPHPRFVKVVRTRIARFLAHGTVTYEPITDERVLIDGLRKKLVEEAAEYLLNPSLDELADVYDVVRALATRDLGMSIHEVVDESLDKHRERGDFDEGYGMFVHSTAPPRHEGEHARTE